MTVRRPYKEYAPYTPKKGPKPPKKPSAAVVAGAELGALALTEDMDEGEVMLRAFVAVWSLMAPRKRAERMQTFEAQGRAMLARMPATQRTAALSALAAIAERIDAIVAPDVESVMRSARFAKPSE